MINVFDNKLFIAMNVMAGSFSSHQLRFRRLVHPLKHSVNKLKLDRPGLKGHFVLNIKCSHVWFLEF